MDQKCPSCGLADLVPLVQGLKKCPKCNKLFKIADEFDGKETQKVDLKEKLEGEYIQKNTALNSKYEVAEFGYTAFKDTNYWVAAIVAHSPDFPKSSYIRLSWWKGASNQHYGMMKINNRAIANNLLTALKKFDEDFNDEFDLISKEINRSKQEIEYSNEFNMKKQLCLVCGTKMKKIKRYFECPRCGELVILEDGNPIADIDPKKLDLNYESNLPVNYYLPYLRCPRLIGYIGDTGPANCYRIMQRENPRKKNGMSFFSKTRNLQLVLSESPTINISGAFKWEARKGIGSPNIYTKEELRNLISAVEKTMNDWSKTT